MNLYLKDIKNYAYKSMFNDKISSKIIYRDNISTIDEISQKTYNRINWYLSKYSANACIYFLLDKEEVVYIGQTRNENRIKQHKKDKIFSDVWFVPVRYPYNIIFEHNLLNKYNTKYNKRYPRLECTNFIKFSNLKNLITEEEIKNIYINL